MENFIPQKPEKEIISIRISRKTLAEIDQVATQNDISRNELINQCITFALRHLAGADEEQN